MKLDFISLINTSENEVSIIQKRGLNKGFLFEYLQELSEYGAQRYPQASFDYAGDGNHLHNKLPPCLVGIFILELTWRDQPFIYQTV